MYPTLYPRIDKHVPHVTLGTVMLAVVEFDRVDECDYPGCAVGGQPDERRTERMRPAARGAVGQVSILGSV